MVTLNLTIFNSNATIETVTACDSYQWNGNVYTESNSTDTMVLANQYGCDSVVTLNLTINHSTAGIDTVEACNSYIWHGTEYFASTNEPTYTTTNANGCDSVVILHLTINQCNTTVMTACDSYTWSVSGQTLTDGGTYVSGTDTLVLTINHSTTGIDQQEACDSYTWIDGNVYTESNSIATYTLENAAGCDSTVTLSLTVNYTEYDTVDVLATPGYTIGNNVFYESTVFVDYLTAATGCDSVVTYNITIVDTIWHTVSVVSHDTLRGAAYGTGLYADGTEATVTAIANNGYSFMAWRDANGYVTRDNPYTFTVDSDRELTAVFVVDIVPILADSVTFNVAVSNSTMGTTTPAPGTYRFAVGDNASIQSVAYDGYHFDYWLVSALGVTDTLRDSVYSGVMPVQLAGMTVNVVAVFAENPIVHTYYTVIGQPNDTAMGIVLGSGEYEEGKIATLVAQAKPGYRFTGWSNGATNAMLQFEVVEDVTLIAYFEPDGTGIDDVVTAEVTIYSVGRDIRVEGATGHHVYVYDVNGRLLVSQRNVGEVAEFRMRDTGVYLVKVGDAPAKRVVVMR